MPERNNEYVYQPPAKFTEELRQRINNAGFSDEFKQQIKSAQKEEVSKMYERLTKRNSNGDVASHVDPQKRYMLFVNRLATYEDSGLSPEEVEALRRENERYKSVLKQARAALETCKGVAASDKNKLYWTADVADRAIQAIDELEGTK